jgi:hypothetical protein
MVSSPAPTSTLLPSSALEPALQPDQLELERLVGQLLAGVVLGHDAAAEALPLPDDVAHPLLDRGQVLRGERPLGQEVVVEAVGDGGGPMPSRVPGNRSCTAWRARARRCAAASPSRPGCRTTRPRDIALRHDGGQVAQLPADARHRRVREAGRLEQRAGRAAACSADTVTEAGAAGEDNRGS